MSLYLGNNLISGVAYPVEPSRNIGQIIQSTIPLSDAGLHLLDGSLISGSGSYSAFVDYIASIYDASANYFCTEADWQTSVSTYGVCGKFVYDSVNNTVRLPKVTGFIEGASGVANLGNLTEAGLPNIDDTFYCYDSLSGIVSTTGLFRNTTVNSHIRGVHQSEVYTTNGVNFDASRSNSIYGNSNTVQPQSIKVLYYIVIATTTKTSIEVDIDEIAADLNGKADVDLTNVNNSGTSKVAGWAMPSVTYTNLTLGASGSTYTAPANGWFAIFGYNGGSNYYVEMKANNVIFSNRSGYSGNDIGLSCPVIKGANMTLRYDGFNSVSYFRFIYDKGSESEAS